MNHHVRMGIARDGPQLVVLPHQNTSPRLIRAEGLPAGSPAFVCVRIGAQRYLTAF